MASFGAGSPPPLSHVPPATHLQPEPVPMTSSLSASQQLKALLARKPPHPHPHPAVTPGGAGGSGVAAGGAGGPSAPAIVLPPVEAAAAAGAGASDSAVLPPRTPEPRLPLNKLTKLSNDPFARFARNPAPPSAKMRLTEPTAATGTATVTATAGGGNGGGARLGSGRWAPGPHSGFSGSGDESPEQGRKRLPAGQGLHRGSRANRAAGTGPAGGAAFGAAATAPLDLPALQRGAAQSASDRRRRGSKSAVGPRGRDGPP